MNRHPYGGGGGYDASRRGGSPQSPGPDRSRFSRPSGRGGRGGGRGGGPSYYDSNDYDDGGYSSQGYNMNGSSHTDSYYYQGQNQGQNQHFGGPPASSFSNSPAYGSYDQHGQGYGNTVYEDKSPSTRGQYNPSNRGKRPAVRKERDDRVHDTLIEERIQRERPCRTLFIRNIKYETDSNEVRRRFEEHGEIKTFFDLISNRGMVFVTYFDLRAAERARERLQGSEISGRPIDVHYSLPRGDEQNQECDRDKNQGTLLVTLRNSVSGQSIDDTEVRRKFQQFGDVKTVKHVGDRPDQRYVEMYDIRACEEAHDRLRHQGLQDGVMDIVFAWDVPEMPLPPGPLPPSKRVELRERYGEDERPAPRGRGGGRGGRGGGPSRGGGRDNFRDRDPRDREMDDWERDRRDDWSRDRGRRYDDGPGHKGNRYDRESYNQHPEESRLEKAKKVQELLAALKQPSAGSGQPPPPVPPSRMPPMPPSMPPTVAPNNPYYPPPPPPAGSMHQPPPFMPPPNPYAYPPPPPPPPPAAPQPQHVPPPSQSQQPPPALPSSLPANILALLQQAQAQQAPPQASHQQPQQPSLPYGVPQPMPPPPTQSTPNPGLPPAQYQQLLAFMQSQQKRT